MNDNFENAQNHFFKRLKKRTGSFTNNKRTIWKKSYMPISIWGSIKNYTFLYLHFSYSSPDLSSLQPLTRHRTIKYFRFVFWNLKIVCLLQINRSCIRFSPGFALRMSNFTISKGGGESSSPHPRCALIFLYDTSWITYFGMIWGFNQEPWVFNIHCKQTLTVKTALRSSLNFEIICGIHWSTTLYW